MQVGLNDNLPTDAQLKAALCDLVKLQATIVGQLQVITGQLANVTKGISLLVSEIERRSTVNPDRPN